MFYVSGVLFNRQAYAGLKTGYGTLTLGRQYTPLFRAVTQVADPFRTGYVGKAKSLLPTAGNGTRTSNTVYYITPELGGSRPAWPTAWASRPATHRPVDKSADRSAVKVAG